MTGHKKADVVGLAVALFVAVLIGLAEFVIYESAVWQCISIGLGGGAFIGLAACGLAREYFGDE